MPYERLTIAAGDKPEGTKSKQFSVHLLGYVTANELWDQGSSGTRTRPAWIAYAGTEHACRAFTANFRAGLPASPKRRSNAEDDFEIPKKAYYRWTRQKVARGAITWAYLPSVFHLEPTDNKETVEFVSMPPTWWVQRQAWELRKQFGPEAEDAAKAALFAAYVDRRTELPVLQDLGFQLRLYRAATKQRWFETPRGYRWGDGLLYAEGIERLGLEPPVAVRAEKKEFDAFLSVETKRFYDEVKRSEPNRLSAGGRVLRDAGGDSPQLRFDFAVA